jgi:hypothetical protein
MCVAYSHLVSTVDGEVLFMASSLRDVTSFTGVFSGTCNISQHLEGLLVKLEIRVSVRFILRTFVSVDQENLLQNGHFLSNTAVEAYVFQLDHLLRQ